MAACDSPRQGHYARPGPPGRHPSGAGGRGGTRHRNRGGPRRCVGAGSSAGQKDPC